MTLRHRQPSKRITWNSVTFRRSSTVQSQSREGMPVCHRHWLRLSLHWPVSEVRYYIFHSLTSETSIYCLNIELRLASQPQIIHDHISYAVHLSRLGFQKIYLCKKWVFPGVEYFYRIGILPAGTKVWRHFFSICAYQLPHTQSKNFNI